MAKQRFEQADWKAAQRMRVSGLLITISEPKCVQILEDEYDKDDLTDEYGVK